MSLLANVSKGRIKQPVLALVYGIDGVGKSTLGANAPNPIFLGTEKGTANLDVTRFQSPTSFKQVIAAIDELIEAKHDYQTLVIDSLDWLEPLVWEQVCVDTNVKNIEDAGYGKGYVYAIKLWQDMIGRLAKLRETKGMHIIAIAHSQVKLAKDPHAQAEYDRYQLKLNEKAAALWREFVDMVLFANFEIFTKTDKNGKTKAFGEGERYLYTERRPGFDAKNRMGLPFQIPLDWSELSTLVENANPDSPEVLLQNINELITQVGDESIKQKALETVAQSMNDVAKLKGIQNRLTAIVNAA